MKVSQLNGVKNQFVMTDMDGNTYFQSYNSIIATRTYDGEIVLDRTYWDYSRTTSKYRNIFTGLTTKRTNELIKEGKILLTDLN